MGRKYLQAGPEILEVFLELGFPLRVNLTSTDATIRYSERHHGKPRDYEMIDGKVVSCLTGHSNRVSEHQSPHRRNNTYQQHKGSDITWGPAHVVHGDAWRCSRRALLYYSLCSEFNCRDSRQSYQMPYEDLKPILVYETQWLTSGLTFSVCWLPRRTITTLSLEKKKVDMMEERDMDCWLCWHLDDFLAMGSKSCITVTRG